MVSRERTRESNLERKLCAGVEGETKVVFVYSKRADYIHESGGYLESGNGEGMHGPYGDLNKIRKCGQAK
jgi:hypothetical protein